MVRLGLASRKLNVGHKTIVNFLSKKGFSIENNPNARLTDKQYAMLCKEFESSASEKREASSLTIGATQVKRKQKTKRGATLEKPSFEAKRAKLEEKRKVGLEKNIAKAKKARAAREKEREKRKGPPERNKKLWAGGTTQKSRHVGRTVSITETEEDPLHRK